MPPSPVKTLKEETTGSPPNETKQTGDDGDGKKGIAHVLNQPPKVEENQGEGTEASTRLYKKEDEDNKQKLAHITEPPATTNNQTTTNKREKSESETSAPAIAAQANNGKNADEVPFRRWGFPFLKAADASSPKEMLPEQENGRYSRSNSPVWDLPRLQYEEDYGEQVESSRESSKTFELDGYDSPEPDKEIGNEQYEPSDD